MRCGEKIRALRKKKGWTQEYLGTLVHMSDKTISSWENGRSSPDEESIKLLCSAFDVSVNVLTEMEPSESEKISFEGSSIDDIFVVDGDMALDYLMWHQQRTRKTLKVMLASFSLLIAALLIPAMVEFGLPSLVALGLFVLLATTSIVLMKSVPAKVTQEHFVAIESGKFRLDSEAQDIISAKKKEYYDQARSNVTLAIFGLISLLIWFIDTAFDNGWCFSNGMVIIYMVGFSVVIAMCLPMSQHWLAICKLLHEVAPQIPTPFDKEFWRK